MAAEVLRLAPELEDEFLSLHCDRNDAGWCRCVAWHVRTWEGWGERTAEENLSLRKELFASGEHDGYLLRDESRCIGWCQVGLRDRLPKLVAQFELEAAPDTWAITCCFTIEAERGRGRAAFLLGGVLVDLKRRGARRVEAFPARGEELDAGEAWTGPEAMFLAAGFRVVKELPKRSVLALEL
jgi:hypothetical protein